MMRSTGLASTSSVSVPRPLQKFTTEDFVPDSRMRSPSKKRASSGRTAASGFSASHVHFNVRGKESDFNVQDQIERQQRKREENDLFVVFQSLDLNNDGNVSPDDVAGMLKKLGYKPKKQEVEEMVWEVDDDVVGHLSWDNFRKTYYRIRESKEKSEPRALYMLIEFMLFDKDQSGTIDFDETTAVFRTRYGKEAMEKVVKILEDQAEINKKLGGTDVQLHGITFPEFLKNEQLVSAVLDA